MAATWYKIFINSQIYRNLTQSLFCASILHQKELKFTYLILQTNLPWANVLIIAGDKCYSKENEGTRFIRALIFTFMERCHCEHLAEMFTEVSHMGAISIWRPGEGISAFNVALAT